MESSLKMLSFGVFGEHPIYKLIYRSRKGWKRILAELLWINVLSHMLVCIFVDSIVSLRFCRQ